MRNLIFKDLFLSRRLIMATYLCYGILAVVFFLQPSFGRTSLVLISITFSCVPIVVIGREDKFRAVSLTASLPVTRHQIVTARYLMSGCLAAFGLAYSFFLAVLVRLVKSEQTSLIDSSNWAIALGVTVMILSIFLPILLRFGIMALFTLATGFNVLGIVAFLLWQLAPEKLRMFGIVVDVFRALAGLSELLGPFGSGLAALLILALIVLASHALAQKVYRGREF